METTVEILNKIANKLGDENADQYTTVAQALGSIANALGNADPDKIQTVPEALQEILAVAGGGGGTPKAFGVDLLQISIPNGEFTLEQTVFPIGTLNACPMPSLDGYISDLQSISSWATEKRCGTALVMYPSEQDIANSNAMIQSQGGFLMLAVDGDEEAFFVWNEGTAYLASPTLDTVEGAWEFFLYKTNPLG